MRYFDPNNQSPKAVHKCILYANIITLSGTSTNGHTAYITINGVKNDTNLSYLTSNTVTADAWVLANYNFYYLRGFNVASVAGVITVTRVHSWDSTNTINATISTLTGTLTGTLKGTFTLDGSKGKIWEVIFTTDEVVFASPVNIRDGQQFKLIFISTSTTSVTTSALVYVNDTSIVTFDVDTAPYILDAVYAAGTRSWSGNTLVTSAGGLLCQTGGTLAGSYIGAIYYELGNNFGEEITDELGNNILIPEQVYILI